MKAAKRAFWLRQLYQWHWISAALSLVGMLGFAVTGFTLNHAADIPAQPVVTTLERVLPDPILATIDVPEEAERRRLPENLSAWLGQEMSVQVSDREAEWSDEEIFLKMPRPGGDAWLSIDLFSGDVMYEETSRGWVSYFNDLHKGRDTGPIWRWFIDIIAIACVIFCVTGLVIMQFLANRRPVTWPLVGFGFIAPLLLVILFIHS
jgi:hypothetical protein